MKFTPLDIQRREFEKAFRGLEEGEVRGFLHEIAAEWEELLAANQRLREEIVELRERNRQYQDQDRIFRETLLQAQRTKEDILEAVHREKDLLIREAQFKGDELIRQAEQRVIALEVQIRDLKLERARFLQEFEALLNRSRRFIHEVAPEIFPPGDPTVRLDELDLGGDTPPHGVQP
ncbi:MAG: DivIVA domain-containing protein [Acidobacteria bacterium]|nr:DivIVA domain-containing protein [Acidobacteriota bacterium]